MVLSFCHFYLSVQHCYYLTKALWVFFYLCSLHRNRIMGKILLELKFQVTRKTNRPTSTSWFKHWRFIETNLSCHCSSMKKKIEKPLIFSFTCYWYETFDWQIFYPHLSSVHGRLKQERWSAWLCHLFVSATGQNYSLQINKTVSTCIVVHMISLKTTDSILFSYYSISLKNIDRYSSNHSHNHHSLNGFKTKIYKFLQNN